MRLTLPFPRARDRSGAPATSRRGRSRWMIAGAAVIALAAIAYWWLRSGSTTTTATTTATVSQGTLTVTVSGSGSVAAARTVAVPFQQSGTVTSVDVKVGDQVKAGQQLAQIDSADLKLALQRAQADLKAAEAKLAQARGGSPTAQELANARAALASAKANLTKTKTSAATDLQSAQAQLASAQAKLDALENPSQLDVGTAQRAVDKAQASLQGTRDSASQAKTNAELALQNAVNSLTQAQSKYATAQKNWQHVQDSGTDPANPTTTDAGGVKKPNKLNSAQRQQYADAYVQAQASLDSAQNAVTQARVAYDMARQKEVTDVAQAEAGVRSAQAELDALLHPSAADLAQAQASVTQAKATLTNLQGGGSAASLASAEAQATQAQSTLDTLTAPASTPEIAAAEASLLQAQVALATAQRNLDQATLAAPFDGVVSAVAVQEGATAGSGSSITIVDRSRLHIAVSLSETDAAKVQVGQPVVLTFDALPSVTLKGKVATIAPAATVSQNVVTYPVEIELAPGDAAVKVGMSATADIQVQQVDNAILVPTRAIKTSGKTKTVTTLRGPERAPVVVPVTTGLSSGSQTEITSSGGNGIPALKAGDVLSISASTTTSTSTNSNRGGFGGPGGGPGGPPPF